MRFLASPVAVPKEDHPTQSLGHASFATAMNIYSHVLPDMQEKAALAINAALAPKSIGVKIPKSPCHLAPNKTSAF